jgi:hypothetical protein
MVSLILLLLTLKAQAGNMQRCHSVACDADVKVAFGVGHGRPIKFDERLGSDTASQSNLTMRNAGRD